jgi:hypothetical protein
MDAEFFQRWREGRAPFNGQTVTLKDFVPLATLRIALLQVVQQLQDYRPDAALFRLDDWHEHDGFVKEAEPATWQELDTLLTSEQTLKAASTGETHVRRGYFPAERDYYLRLYVPGAYDNPFHAHDDPDLVDYGSFDVTCPEPLMRQIVIAVESAGRIDLEVIATQAFFDRGYGG